jgi:hypothetical protein
VSGRAVAEEWRRTAPPTPALTGVTTAAAAAAAEDGATTSGEYTALEAGADACDEAAGCSAEEEEEGRGG